MYHPEISQGLEIADSLNAGFGIELRYPFLDLRVVDLCLSLPRNQLVRGGLTRWVSREAFADRMPEVVLRRGGKGDPNRSVERALSRDRAALLRTVSDRTERLAQYVDPEVVRRLESAALGGSSAHQHLLWRTLSLDRWLRKLEEGRQKTTSMATAPTTTSVRPRAQPREERT